MEETWELAVVSKKIRVKLAGQELEYDTDQAALKAIGKVVYDIVSPVSEGFGALGDKIRVYRTKSLADTLTEAQHIAEKYSVKLENVSPKFMTQWVEGASSEDTESQDNLQSHWANLLVNMARDKSISGSGFIAIIKQLNPRHARLLKSWMNDATHLKELRGYSYGIIPHIQMTEIESLFLITSEYYYDFSKDKTSDFFAMPGQIEKFNSKYNGLRQHADKTGVEISFLRIGNTPIPISVRQTVDSSDVEGIPDTAFIDRDLLKQMGLLSSTTIHGETSQNENYALHFYGLTALAVSFITAVNEPIEN